MGDFQNNVYCLIRKRQSDENLEARMIKTFIDLKIILDKDEENKKKMEAAIRDRVTVVQGNLFMKSIAFE